jgi:hypothetical protein
MRTYWVLDKNNNDAPLALVEGNGRLQVVDIIRFGPALVELDAQQQVWDSLIGRLLPTLKPFVASYKINEAGVEPAAAARSHLDLIRVLRDPRDAPEELRRRG